MRDKRQARAVLWGAALGALFGSVLALLFQRRRQQGGTTGVKPIRTQQLVRLGAAVVAILRQFAELI